MATLAAVPRVWATTSITPGPSVRSLVLPTLLDRCNSARRSYSDRRLDQQAFARLCSTTEAGEVLWMVEHWAHVVPRGQLVEMENLLHAGPPFAPSARFKRALHGDHDFPPLLGLRIGSHSRHIC